MKLLLMLFALAAVAVSACSGPARSASSPVGTPTSASTADPRADPYAIPAVITPSYVDTVFAALNHVNGDAVRSLIAAGQLSDGVKRDLRAVYNEPLYAQEVTIAQQTLDSDLANIRRPPGDRKTIAVDVISATSSCIFAQTRSTFSKVVVKPGPPSASEYFELTPTRAGSDPDRLNPTPWSMTFNASYLTATAIPNQCSV